MINFIKVDPTVYVIQYTGGKIVREGLGLSFFYFTPMTSLVTVPVASRDVPFIFEEVTNDYQDVTIQGQVAFRVADAKKLAHMLNFNIDQWTQKYVSDDPNKLPDRVINLVQVLVRKQLGRLDLKTALSKADDLVTNVKQALDASEVLKQLGVEVLDLSILAIKPNPETARALEAQMREELLMQADEAIYARRNSAVEQERQIRENELNTEIAVENKQRQIRETQMDAERAVQQKKQLIKEEGVTGQITLEEKNKQLVELTVQNTKVEADAKAYSIGVVMDRLQKIDPKIINALASTGMEPGQLIALGFREIAENSGKIGELNISPDLLRELTKTGKK